MADPAVNARAQLPDAIVSPRTVGVEAMRALEAAAVAGGIPEAALQANAARSLANLVPALEQGPADGSIVVLVGPGNNGRDAMLCGRLLACRGYRVSMFLGPRHAVATDELRQLEADRVPIAHYAENGPDALVRLDAWLDAASLAVDGLLGIGARGAIRSPLDEVAARLNGARTRADGRLRVLAVDIASGVDADIGTIDGIAVRADITAALGAVKAGVLRFPGAAHSGRVVCLSIGLRDDGGGTASPRILQSASVLGLLRKRDLAGHKGSFGKLLVIGGSSSYLGAPLLSALAAARSGCGLVAMGVPRAVQQAAASVVPEATFIGPTDIEERPDQALEVIVGSLPAFDAVLIGPGLGRSAGVERWLRALLTTSHDGWPPVVLDADALNALARWDEWWEAVVPRLVLTPHHGEMSRLTGESLERVAAENWDIAIQAAERWGQTVVLKGPHTTVTSHGHGTAVHAAANPALATAGSGDVLAGLIGGLLAQGYGVWDAARLGVVAHGLAAEQLVRARGWRSLIASDLPAELPLALASLSER